MTAAPPWTLDEVASAGRENLDADHVGRYDDKEDGDAPAEVAWLRSLGLGADDTVVDLGAGTGQFTVAVAPWVARVVAVDVSPVMLERLRHKVAGLDGVEVAQAGFLTYQHAGPPADLVYSRYALHHLPDLWKGVALARVARVLRPGGLFRLWDVVYDFEPHEVDERVAAWIAATASTSVADGWTGDELAEHVRDEHSTFTWLLEPMLERAGLAIEEREVTPDGIFARYLCRARWPGR
jgi:SAM-dependent methyltransferase